MTVIRKACFANLSKELVRSLVFNMENNEAIFTLISVLFHLWLAFESATFWLLLFHVGNNEQCTSGAVYVFGQTTSIGEPYAVRHLAEEPGLYLLQEYRKRRCPHAH